MAQRRLHLPPAELVARGLRRIRDELAVPDGHEPEAIATAERARDRRAQRRDLRQVPFVTIDPPGSRDLDQAYAAERDGDGYRVSYAIADVAAFVEPGDAVDRASWARAVTLYPPDGRVPLHPAALSEGTASLLAGQDRAALVWDLRLDAAGEVVAAHLEAATIRSRAQLTYLETQLAIERGDDGALGLLREIGERREVLEIERGGVHLPLPAQEVTATDGRYDLEFEVSLPVEEWNAHVSLMTGLAAAELLGEAGVGILRTLPPAEARTVAELRRVAAAVDIEWPDGVDYPEFIRHLDATTASGAALLTRARAVFRGASYRSFTGALPPDAEHAAIGGHYSHVTAPLRRLCDRYANEILVAHGRDAEPPTWAVEALDALPEAMAKGRSREGNVDRAVIDLIEAVLLSCRVGERLSGAVVGRRGDDVIVMLDEPAIVARAHGGAELGAEVVVRVESADPDRRRADLVVERSG